MVVPFQNPDSHKLIFGDKVFDTLDISVFWVEGNTPPINMMSQIQGKPLIKSAFSWASTIPIVASQAGCVLF